MPLSTKEVIYLGNFADADTSEAAVGTLDDPTVYLGTFGSAGDPLFDHEVNVTFDDLDGSDAIEIDNISAETITYDLGAGAVTGQVDSLEVVDLTVTYADGTTASLSNVVMFQDSNGNLFLSNSNFAGTDLNSPSRIQEINVTSLDGGGYTGLIHTAFQDFVCFLSGTRIATPSGPRPVEDIRPGDLVATRDHGPQPVLWAGASQVIPSARTRPVCIPAGSLGPGHPRHDLYVSRQHRVLLRSRIVERMFATPEVLCPARLLVGSMGIVQSEWQATRPLAYHHLLFLRHEVIFANGAAVESLLPGAEALRAIGERARAQVVSCLPGLAHAPCPPTARPLPKARRLRALLRRKLSNAHALAARI